MQYLVSCDVDAIGTDNPLLVIAALDHTDYRGGLPRILNILPTSWQTWPDESVVNIREPASKPTEPV